MLLADAKWNPLAVAKSLLATVAATADVEALANVAVDSSRSSSPAVATVAAIADAMLLVDAKWNQLADVKLLVAVLPSQLADAKLPLADVQLPLLQHQCTRLLQCHQHPLLIQVQMSLKSVVSFRPVPFSSARNSMDVIAI